MQKKVQWLSETINYSTILLAIESIRQFIYISIIQWKAFYFLLKDDVS